ncbi:MAG: ABC transporter ATP-binding protein [Eubacteriales bacterium]|nr:ABC transporter ATP-binding protein/permease [Clostridiales bacterium]MDD7302534.1 ABC transporter ATP-binding protein [Eubacteriales bacterium]MDY4434374.1 ABC transporter ATP-binding protein [Candidatus Flemingibacterium sp.]
MLKRFISYYKPHLRLFTLDMLASLVISLTGIIYPIITRRMLNDLIPNREYRLIVIFGIGLLAVYLVRMGLNYFVQYYGHVMGVKMQAQMRSDMFRRLEELPYSFYDSHETGKIMSRMTNDLMDISELAHHGPENLLISGITIITSFCYLISINVPLTLIVFACVPLLVIISLSLRVKMRDAFKKSRESVAEINAALESSISGIRVTKAFTNSEKETEKFEVGNGKFVSSRSAAYKAMGQFHSGTSFVTDIFNVVVLIAGGLFLYNNKISFGDYSTFIVSIGIFVTPVMTLINFMEQYQNGVTGFERFVEIMDAKPEKDSDGAKDAGKLSGDIALSHVSYSYDGAKEVLRDVSLKINKGETFALVGPSGGGKTTICHLIPHFYDVTDGQILLDGKEIHSLTMESVRRNIGIVQQDIYLFNASVRENILYGRLDATDEEVMEAAKRANIHDYILSLPEGYETKIGERGVKLSGGQKQRLSIARVFLKDPSILILDEATSALDNATEILIQKSLDELCKGRTTIVVAHRLSTVRNADRIAVVDEGHIIEEGTHKELLEKGGEYAALYNAQLRVDA